MRRVGDASWRKFASQGDAGRAFGLSNTSVSRLIKKRQMRPRVDSRRAWSTATSRMWRTCLKSRYTRPLATASRWTARPASSRRSRRIIFSAGRDLEGAARRRGRGPELRRSRITKGGAPVAAPAPAHRRGGGGRRRRAAPARTAADVRAALAAGRRLRAPARRRRGLAALREPRRRRARVRGRLRPGRRADREG